MRIDYDADVTVEAHFGPDGYTFEDGYGNEIVARRLTMTRRVGERFKHAHLGRTAIDFDDDGIPRFRNGNELTGVTRSIVDALVKAGTNE